MLRKPYAFVNRFSPYIFKFVNLLFVTHTTLAYLIDKQNIYIYKDASSLIETHNKRSVSTTFSYFIPTLEHFSLTEITSSHRNLNLFRSMLMFPFRVFSISKRLLSSIDTKGKNPVFFSTHRRCETSASWPAIKARYTVGDRVRRERSRWVQCKRRFKR